MALFESAMKALSKLAFVVLIVAIAACSNFGRGSKPASAPAPAATPAPAAKPAAAPAATTAPAATAVPAETFFKVTDVSSGKVFYTRKVSRNGAAVLFKEERTGAETTLQNSQVLEIQREAYMAGLAAQVVAPAPAVPAAAPSPASAAPAGI